jgi:hypothetical protein
MSRNLRARIARLERQRLAGQSTPRAASFFDFAAAALQGRQDDADALWMQLPEEDREHVIAALGSPDPLIEIEARINAPLLSLPCGLRELPSSET